MSIMQLIRGGLFVWIIGCLFAILFYRSNIAAVGAGLALVGIVISLPFERQRQRDLYVVAIFRWGAFHHWQTPGWYWGIPALDKVEKEVKISIRFKSVELDNLITKDGQPVQAKVNVRLLFRPDHISRDLSAVICENDDLFGSIVETGITETLSLLAKQFSLNIFTNDFGCREARRILILDLQDRLAPFGVNIMPSTHVLLNRSQAILDAEEDARIARLVGQANANRTQPILKTLTSHSTHDPLRLAWATSAVQHGHAPSVVLMENQRRITDSPNSDLVHTVPVVPQNAQANLSFHSCDINRDFTAPLKVIKSNGHHPLDKAVQKSQGYLESSV